MTMGGIWGRNVVEMPFKRHIKVTYLVELWPLASGRGQKFWWAVDREAGEEPIIAEGPPELSV